MHAIISDIHGNLEALDAVVTDARACGVPEIYCLGDIVGYGPNPIECVERVMSWPVVLMGNVDQAAMSDDALEGWSAHAARKTVLQFRKTLRQRGKESCVGEYLRQRPRKFTDAEASYVHGTIRDPLYEYLYPEAVHEPRTMDQIAQGFDRLCFCGHTHLPGIFSRSAIGEWDYVTAEECDHQFDVGDGKTICNVGSVGQPRDSNPLACYVLYDAGKITFRRVAYDIDRTIACIKANDEFDDMFAERLREGR